MKRQGSLEQRDVKALQLAMANQEVGTLIDVRSPGEYSGGHVPGAINIPLAGIAKAHHELDPEETIWLICRSGSRSGQAAAVLSGQGLDVINVTGGTMAWRRAGFPVAPEGAGSSGSLLAPILASLTLGLAPFTPEPHVLGKLKWVAGGAAGMAPMDWFDLLMHGAPWVWLAWAVARRIKR